VGPSRQREGRRTKAGAASVEKEKKKRRPPAREEEKGEGPARGKRREAGLQRNQAEPFYAPS
jgi:hypothetical protein